jgi:hypothetical protein
MFEGLFGRDALTEEQVESTLLGIDDEICVQIAMVVSSPTLKPGGLHLVATGYMHGYVFGIGGKLAEDACELFNVKPGKREEQRNLLVTNLFRRVFQQDSDEALTMCLKFAQRGSPGFREGMADGRTEIEHLRRNGEFIRLFAMNAVAGDHALEASRQRREPETD